MVQIWYMTCAVILMVVAYLASPFGWQIAVLTVATGLTAAVWIVPAVWQYTQISQPAIPNAHHAVIWITIAVHLIACFSQLVIRNGTEMSAHPELRGAWIATHRGLWAAAWSTWPFASASLLWFCRTWVRSFSANGTVSHQGLAATGLIALGVVCDLMGETVAACCALPFVEPQDVEPIYRLYQWLSPSVANGLYCVGGLWLNWIDYQTGRSTRLANGLGWVVWTSGLGLTWAAIAAYNPGIVALAGMVMVLFVLWLAVIDRNWQRR